MTRALSAGHAWTVTASKLKMNPAANVFGHRVAGDAAQPENQVALDRLARRRPLPEDLVAGQVPNRRRQVLTEGFVEVEHRWPPAPRPAVAVDLRQRRPQPIQLVQLAVTHANRAGPGRGHHRVADLDDR